MIESVNGFVAARIREVRLERGLKVTDMVRLTGIPAGSYYCLESGCYRLSLDNLFRILMALQISIEDLWPQTARKAGPGEPVDEALVSAALGDAPQKPAQRSISVEDVVAQVAVAYGVRVEDMMGRAKRNRSAPRVAAGLIVQQTPQLKLSGLCLYLHCSEGGLRQSIRLYRESVLASSRYEVVLARLARKKS